jgi:2'-5' RNA ligase
MRLFAAVDLEPTTRRAAFALGARVARGLAGSGDRGRPRVSWVKEENLHITMRFLGEVEDRRAADLVAQFTAPLATRVFDIELGGVGVFPPAGPPRVVWLGVTSGADRLFELNAELEARFDAWGYGREPRSFRAHLTLGRCREPLGPRARERVVRTDAGDIGTSRIDGVVLYESRLSPSGPAYVALARAPLSG